MPSILLSDAAIIISSAELCSKALTLYISTGVPHKSASILSRPMREELPAARIIAVVNI